MGWSSIEVRYSGLGSNREKMGKGITLTEEDLMQKNFSSINKRMKV